MVQMLSIRHPRFAAIVPAVERALGHMGSVAASGKVELAHVLPVFSPHLGELLAPERNLNADERGDIRLHVQILIDGEAKLFARFVPSVEDDAGWILGEITHSPHAAALNQAIARLEGDRSIGDDRLAIIEIPSYYFRGLALQSDDDVRILPVICPPQLELPEGELVDLARLHDALARSGIGDSDESGTIGEEMD